MIRALRGLLVVVSAFALLGHGGVELAPRLVTSGASIAAVSAGTPAAGRPVASRPAAESQPVERGASLRTSLAAAVPTGSAEAVSGPGAYPVLARHLVARPLVRPPSQTPVQGAFAGVDGRAPPAAAGT